jgi:hypothetical protein
VRLGEDPWEGLGSVFILSNELVTSLHSRGIYFLWDARFLGHNHVG